MTIKDKFNLNIRNRQKSQKLPSSYKVNKLQYFIIYTHL